MGTLGEYIGTGGDGFGFEHGEIVERLRAGLVEDRYSKKLVRQDWNNPEVLTIVGASIGSVGQTQADGSQRRQTTVAALLTVTDPNADVVIGDRIRRGAQVWSCVEFPETDKNPFTGWRPTLVIALEEYHG
ncbi:hypothetical protein [Microbacterium sp. NPDC089696]|uniref:hypothetical protein n=1 Tax=Microbacterium sp. NPDC089696 TaxID=3364199 RepID=UPI0037F2C1EB